jgi:hypothetical protein
VIDTSDYLVRCTAGALLTISVLEQRLSRKWQGFGTMAR